MWKLLLSLFLLSPVYAQVFTEDLEKINYYLSEKQIDQYISEPTTEGIPAHYLKSLVAAKYFDPITGCEEDFPKFHPKNPRYEVLLVSEDVAQQETTVVLAKYDMKEEEHVLVTEAKKVLESQKDHPGVIEKTFSQEKGKRIIHYVNPNTEIAFKSNLRGENRISVDLDKIKNDDGLNSHLKLDVVNRLDVKQVITNSTELKGALESGHTTGRRDLSSLDGMNFQLDKVKAEARLSQEISPRVKSYTEVNYTQGITTEHTKTIAGLHITTPQNAQIIIFTSHSSRQNRGHTDKDEETEFGVEYKTKNGVKFFGRVRDSEAGTAYETGVEVKLGK